MSMTEKHSFQAEIARVLDIVIHSLYTDREIFLRELISNAADALEKLRFLQAGGEPVRDPDRPLEIQLTADDKARTLAITDAGVGMTRDELVENLGTIAHSGSKAFFAKVAEAKEKAALNLIGQFGVGFYSAFMVATKVEVFTRAHQPDATAWHWVSEGAGGYEIAPGPEDLPRGTRIVLHLKEDAQEFSQNWQIERVVKRYSSFVPFPIRLNDGAPLNTVRALWARPKSEIKDEEYREFYEFIGHDPDPPLARLHFTADAPLAVQALLFVPARNLESLGMGKSESEVNLYCRKVLIQPHAKGLFPDWLRFLKGVVDSEDLPLNISRETMQDSALLRKLNRAITGRFLKFLAETAEKEPETYRKIHTAYHRFLKEGVVTDFAHRESLAKLLRFESSLLPTGELTSLTEYMTRLKEGQKDILHLAAPSREAAEASPYFEAAKSLGHEVLFLTEAGDEYVLDQLGEFDGRKLLAAEKAGLRAGGPGGGLDEADAASLSRWFKDTLGDAVRAVRISQRLVSSPAAVVDADEHTTATMRRIFRALQQDGPKAELDLELNPRHPLMARLNQLRDADAGLAKEIAAQVFDNARVAAGLMENPAAMVQRLTGLLERVAGK